MKLKKKTGEKNIVYENFIRLIGISIEFQGYLFTYFFSMLFGVNKRCRRVKNILSKSINIRHTPPSPLWRIKPLPQKKKKANTHREKYRKRNETFIKSNDSTFACCFKINVLTRQAISWLLIFYQRRVMFAQMMTSSMIKTRL
jgi:hypothetical protein